MVRMKGCLPVSVSLDINEKKLVFTSLEKELWPGEGITKYNLIKYYLEVAPNLLPHLRGRFLVIQRFPNGIDKEGFYQKNIPAEAPSWISTAPFRHGEKTTRYLLADGPETLAWLGNLACLEIHPWLSPVANPDQPDFAVFDLDPAPGIPFSSVCRVALELHRLMQKRDLRVYPKTSGASGIQVYLPLQPRYSYTESRDFCHNVFRELYRLLPRLTTMERSVARRGRKIYLDHLQNARGKTLVAPYSPRPLPGAPVSTPLEWHELSKASLHPSSFNILTIMPRLQARGDIFSPVLTDRQHLS
ncbi:MAG: non-homologous end-joining DNA ligase [Bacillota bacterium]